MRTILELLEEVGPYSHYRGITPETAHQVLWHYGLADGAHGVGMAPGSFKESLYSTISKADEYNKRKLIRAFPGEVVACVLIEQTPDGADILRKIAVAGHGTATERMGNNDANT